MALSCPSVFTRLSFLGLNISRPHSLAAVVYSGHIYSPRVYSPRAPPLCRRSACRGFSSTGVRTVLDRVWSTVQTVRGVYDRFLERRFPRFYKIHITCVEGFKLVVLDVKELTRIKLTALREGQGYEDLTYRDLDKLRQVQQYIKKALPMFILSIPPFANYLVLTLMYFFPRQLLIPYFWTPTQRLEFRRIYHSQRARHHGPLLDELQRCSRGVRDPQMQRRLQHLCSKVRSGQKPQASEVLAVRSLFSGRPLGIRWLSADQLRPISEQLFLTSRLPAFLLWRHINNHGHQLQLLDRALSRLGVDDLSPAELQEACYLRGINADLLSEGQNRAWLRDWLKVSLALKDQELSLLLHAVVFFSDNKTLQ